MDAGQVWLSLLNCIFATPLTSATASVSATDRLLVTEALPLTSTPGFTTFTGAVLEVVVPSPSWPAEFSPQDHTDSLLLTTPDASLSAKTPRTGENAARSRATMKTNLPKKATTPAGAFV